MKILNLKPSKFQSVGLLLTAVFALSAGAAQAADTWTGATSANWADSNWSGANNPPASGDALIFTSATGIGGTTLNDNLTLSTFNLASITFSSGAAAFTITGNAFNLTGGVTNGSTSLETFSNLVSFANAQIINTATGGGISLGGNLSGAGSLTVSGAGTVTLSGVDTYVGSTTNNGGTLFLNSGTALPATTTLVVNSGGIVDLNGTSNNIANFAPGNAAGTITNSAAGIATLTLTNWLGSQAALIAGPIAIQDFGLYQLAGGALSNYKNTFTGGLLLGQITSGAPGYTRYAYPTTTAPVGVPGNITNSIFGRGTITIGRSAADRSQILCNNTGPDIILNNIIFNTSLGADRVGAFRVDVNALILAGTLTANAAPLTLSCNSVGTGIAILSGQITGTNGLWIRYNGSDVGAYMTCILSNVTANANNFQGGIEVDASGASAAYILAMGATNQFPNGAGTSDITNSGTIKLNGYSQTINGLWGVGVVDGVSGTPTLTMGANNDSFTNTCTIKNTVGTMSLTKIGSGIASLAGSLSYSGNTTVSAGILSLPQANFYVNSTVSIASGATLDLPGGGTYSVAGLVINGVSQPNGTYNSSTTPGYITGSGQLTVTGGSGSETWTGATSANWSQSNWTGGNNPPNTGDSVTFSSATGVGGATLNDDLTSSSFVISALNFSSSAAGFTVNGNPFDLAGPITNNASSPETLNNPITLASLETISTTNSGGSLTLGGAINGSGGITATGPGVLTLSGANSYSGITTVNGGKLLLGNPSALPPATILSLATNSILDLAGNYASFSNFNATTSISIITNSSAVASGLTLNGWTVGLSSLVADGATAPVALSFQSIGSPSGSSLNNISNTFSGGLTIGNVYSGLGYARLGVNIPPINTGVPGHITNSIYGRGPITIGNSPSDYAQLFLNYGNSPTNYTVLNNIIFNTTLGADRVGAIRLESAWTLLGTLIASNAPVNLSCNNTSTTNGVTMGGYITGPYGLWLQANSYVPSAMLTVTLSNVTANANDYQGDTEIDSPHVIALGAANQIPHGPSAGNLLVDGTFSLNGYSQTVNGLATHNFATGIVDGKSGTPTLTVGDNDAYSEFDGVIKNSAGNLSLTKIGAGNLFLSATNTYTGNTTVNAGTLELAQPYLATNSTVTVASGATLQLDFSVTNTVSGLVLSGVAYTNGVFNSTTSPSLIAGGGSLQVVPVAPLPNTPTNISYTLSGGGTTLTISWPLSYQGWILQEQTNSLYVGLQSATNAWFDVAGTASVTSTNLPVSKTIPTAFYRLRHP